MIINIQDDILKLHRLGLLDALLADKTTKRHIMWATDAYLERSERYERNEEITPELISGDNIGVIKTRARKAFEQQSERTRKRAEVFTPLFIVKRMNDAADEAWFDRKDGINKLDEQGHIKFTSKHKWQHYVENRRMELTCGEAPFLVTRYDVESGEIIPLAERTGILDRKMRVVNENTEGPDEWLEWTYKALRATYGYEFQGDNLLIARINVVMTFVENMENVWRRPPTEAQLRRAINIVTWNIWQMDGLTDRIPFSTAEEQLSLFERSAQERQPYCRIYNWRQLKSIQFRSMNGARTRMKFDYIIGNPPYQDDVDNQGDRANPVYDKFMDEAFEIADVVELIHPARFLFNAGQTPKQWNRKMLNDEHFTVLHYEPDASTIFPNTDIKGGIAISLRNSHENYGAIETFTSFPELNDIVRKVSKVISTSNRLNTIIASQGLYRFSARFFEEHPEAVASMGKGTGSKIVSSVMEKLPDVFLNEVPDPNDYVRLLGRIKSQRTWKWIKREYLETNAYLESYNLLIPEANNSGKFGETLTDPSFAKPGEGSTDTFLSAGVFNNGDESSNLAKYIKCKFFRTLLGVKKVTQHCPPPVWAMIPLQDFTPASDIDWSKSIPEIDQQLYAKYGLDEKEIEFIETHVKEMS